MRLSGYVPRLDIDPDFTIEYIAEKEYFKFRLTAYAVYIGKKKSECILGIDGVTLIPTQKSKSKESLQEQESQSNQK